MTDEDSKRNALAILARELGLSSKIRFSSENGSSTSVAGIGAIQDGYGRLLALSYSFGEFGDRIFFFEICSATFRHNPSASRLVAASRIPCLLSP
jgi:hypothetical protein